MSFEDDNEEGPRRVGNRAMEWSEVKDEQFETRCVSELMRVLRMPTSMRARVERAAKHHGRLHIGSFAEALPDFPVNIAVRNSKKLKEFASLERFFKVKHMQALTDLFTTVAADDYVREDRLTLLLLRLPFLPSMMCIHDGDSDPVVDNHCQVRLPLGDERHLTFESVEAFFLRFRESITQFYEDNR